MQTSIYNICPRNCNVNRSSQKSFCNANTLKIAKVMKHFLEEPTISGTMGSGTIFFSNCNLKCIYCQNAQISHEGLGKETSIENLANHNDFVLCEISCKLKKRKQNNRTD